MNLLECEKLAYELLEKHELKDYKFQWLKRLSRWNCAGKCIYKKKLIKLQPTFVEKNSIEDITNTLLHEIAHALMPKHNHNKFWKRKAIEIGCSGERLYSSKVIK